LATIMRVRPSALLLSLVALLGPASGCGDDLPPIPASHDPKGEDLVVGAVVAATETSGGIRLNKIIFVDDYPPPLDYEFHMIAYEPKAQTWEEAQRMWKNKQVEIIVKHFTVRRIDFMVRDYRVLFKEPVTPQEKAYYDEAKPRYPVPRRPPGAATAAPAATTAEPAPTGAAP
jgi:hypothetical protein